MQNRLGFTSNIVQEIASYRLHPRDAVCISMAKRSIWLCATGKAGWEVCGNRSAEGGGGRFRDPPHFDTGRRI